MNKSILDRVNLLVMSSFLTAAVSTPLLAQADSPGRAKRMASAESQKETSRETQAKSQSDMVPGALINIPADSSYYSPFALVVDKKSRTLTVWQQTSEGLKEVASFPADMGKNQGDKRSTGDHKTPEGIYFLQSQLEGNSLDFNLYGKRAFTTDYPNFFDRLEGKTGSGIWLHAIPDQVPLTRGSRGCVVVRNDAILGLSQYVKLGRTPILIQGATQMIAAPELMRTSAELTQWLESWRAAWEGKDLESYIANYDKTFNGMNMNREQWHKHKARLAEQYKNITVRLSRPAIYADRNNAVVRFLQEYTSDQHTDVGEKVLYLKKGSQGYRIVGETWELERSPLARQEIAAAKTMASASASTASGEIVCIPGQEEECMKASSAR